MGTLFIDRKGLHVKVDGNALTFYVDGAREGMVPLNPLKRVVVVGNVTIEASAIHKMAQENISVVFLSGRRLRFSGMLHGKLHNNGLLRVKQYEKSLGDFALDFSREVVAAKTAAQSDFLREACAARPDLCSSLTGAIGTLERIGEKLKPGAGNIAPESLRGLEGSAASAYFGAFVSLFPGSLNFTGRKRRPPDDPVNAMLSLCYTFLHFELVREIEAVGLDPVIGFYHRFEYGRESLACDCVEMFRPEVDRFVWGLFRERDFGARDFARDIDRPGCYLKKGGRQRFYPLYEEWARSMRPAFAGSVRELARAVMDGQPYEEEVYDVRQRADVDADL